MKKITTVEIMGISVFTISFVFCMISLMWLNTLVLGVSVIAMFFSFGVVLWNYEGDKKMTYNSIIKDLETSGSGTKQKVLNELKGATVEDLERLVLSIMEEINKRKGEL